MKPFVCFILITQLFFQLNKCFCQSENLKDLYDIGFRVNYSSIKNFNTIVFADSTVNSYDTDLRALLYNIIKHHRDSSWCSTLEEIGSEEFSLQNIHKGKPNIFTLTNIQMLNWQIFYKNYPGSAGMLFVSPVYFNACRNKAIFMTCLLRTQCGNGTRKYVLLKKDATGRWASPENFQSF